MSIDPTSGGTGPQHTQRTDDKHIQGQQPGTKLDTSNTISQTSGQVVLDPGQTPVDAPALDPTPNVNLLTTEDLANGLSEMNTNNQVTFSQENLVSLRNDARNMKISDDLGEATTEILTSNMDENGLIQGFGDGLAAAIPKYIGPDGHLDTERLLADADKAAAAYAQRGDGKPTEEEFSIFTLMLLLSKLQTARYDGLDKIAKSTQITFLATFDKKVKIIKEKATIELTTTLVATTVTLAGSVGAFAYTTKTTAAQKLEMNQRNEARDLYNAAAIPGPAVAPVGAAQPGDPAINPATARVVGPPAPGAPENPYIKTSSTGATYINDLPPAYTETQLSTETYRIQSNANMFREGTKSLADAGQGIGRFLAAGQDIAMAKEVEQPQAEIRFNIDEFLKRREIMNSDQGESRRLGNDYIQSLIQLQKGMAQNI